jgi:hypothetical protein
MKVKVVGSVEAGGLSSSAEEEWLREQAVRTSRRGGLFNHKQRILCLILNKHLVCGAKDGAIFLLSQPLLLYQGGERPDLNVSAQFNSQDAIPEVS